MPNRHELAVTTDIEDEVVEEEVIGTVDNFQNARVFGGWAHARSGLDAAPLQVFAFYDGVLVGETQADYSRADLGKNCGFSVRTNRDIDAEDIVAGRFTIAASSAARPHENLPFYPGMVKSFQLFSLGRKAGEAGDREARRVLSGLTETKRPLLKAVAEAVVRHDSKDKSKLLGNESGLLGNESGRELSMFGLQVGLVSPDGTSVVGREGRMFVLAGTNRLIDQYLLKESDAIVQDTAKAWLKLFETRRARLSAASVAYTQIIIPEKSSVVPEFFPISITAPTALLKRINTLAAETQQIADFYLDGMKLLAQDARRLDVFRKIDSHLSAYGTGLVFSALIKKSVAQGFIEAVFDRSAVIEADLGAKFLNAPFYEEVLLPRVSDSAPFEAGLRQVEFHRPDGGRHIGTRIVWKNDTAASPLTALVFGNSFFERGNTAATLSWWGARYFTNFHFVWGPDIDYDYVDKIKPDVVICQTNERFLSRIPKR